MSSTESTTAEVAKKVTAEVTLGGKAVTVNKLKAGRFYEAQKVFSEIIGSASGASGLEDESPEAQANQVQALMAEMPRKMAEFVSVCTDMPLDELLDTADPEEIPPAFETCYKLNNVMENLKKFQSPMQAIGEGMEAEESPAKKTKK